MSQKFTPSQTLDMLIRAKYPVIAIESPEESRIIASVKAVAAEQGKTLFIWSVSQGLVGSDDKVIDDTQDPIGAFRYMTNYTQTPTIFVMKDLHNIVNGPTGAVGDIVAIRWLRDVARLFTEKPYTLVLISPAFTIPNDLTKDIAVLDWALPTAKDMEALLDTFAKRIDSRKTSGGGRVTVDISNGKRERIVRALAGLTENEATNVLSWAVIANRALDESAIGMILSEKKQIIAKSGTLEYYDTDVSQGDIGGLALLKAYTARKRAAFGKEAEAYGLPAPKGILLVGPSGSGKSLTAKASTGGVMPLLRLDVGSLMGSLLGQSEANTRNALKVAEAVAPCVLWIDEVEKAFAGMEASGMTDGGVTKRILGTILTWMEERKAPVYVVATANDVTSLPPELIQRFDDLFFVDLPTAEERAEIVSIHLGKLNRIPKKFDLKKIAAEMEGFSGREITKAIAAALDYGFGDDAREITTKDILKAAKEIVPTSKTKAETIKSLREWAKTRARPASALTESVAPQGERALEL